MRSCALAPDGDSLQPNPSVSTIGRRPRLGCTPEDHGAHPPWRLDSLPQPCDRPGRRQICWSSKSLTRWSVRIKVSFDVIVSLRQACLILWPPLLGYGMMLQITPQMKLLVAVDPADFRNYAVQTLIRSPGRPRKLIGSSRLRIAETKRREGIAIG